MTRPLIHLLVELLAGCVVLVSADRFAPRAWAGCGGHVTSDKERADASRPADDVPPRPPCSGPTCSQRQDTPPPAPAPTGDPDERGLLPEPLTPAGDPSARRREARPLRPSPGPVSFIFDPPRPAAG